MKKKIFFLCMILVLLFTGCGGEEPVIKNLSFTEDEIIAIPNGVDMPIALENVTLEEVTFTVLDDSVVEVTNGKIVAKKMGETEVIATYGEITDTLKVVVNVEFTIPESVNLGEEIELEIDNYDGSLDEFEVAFSNEAAKFEDGKIISKAPGSVDITLTNKENNKLTLTKTVVILPVKPILVADITEVEIDEFIEFTIENYDSLDLFDFTVSDEEVLEIDDEYFGYSLKAGKVTVTASLKTDPSVFATLEITVKNEKIKYKISNSKIIIGEEFIIDLYNYDSEEVFEFVISDSTIFEKTGEKTYKALKEGTAKLTVTLKEDPEITTEIEVVIYDKVPEIYVAQSQIMVEGTVKLDLVNYLDKEKFIWQINDETLADFENYIITAKRAGTLVVSVTSKDDPTLTSKINIEIIPIQPEVMLTSSYLKVGGRARLFIANLEKLETNELDKFEVTVEDSSILSYESEMITALKEGTTTLKLVSKENSQIQGKIEVVVTKTSSIKDDNGEVADGVLLLSAENEEVKVQAGEFLKLFIDGAVNQENYKWVSTNTSVATVNDNGRVIGVNAGVAQIAAVSKTNQQVKGVIYVTVYGTPNVDYAARLVKIATEELGYVEGDNNNTKYGAWYNLNYEPWCAMFVSWCANQAGISTDIILKYCGCTAGMKWFNDKGQFQSRQSGYKPKAGDIVFFRDIGETSPTLSTHTGIVYACDGVRVYTIEGNSADMCRKRSYYLTSEYIMGYGVPEYPEFEGEPAVFEPGNPESGEGADTQ